MPQFIRIRFIENYLIFEKMYLIIIGIVDDSYSIKAHS